MMTSAVPNPTELGVFPVASGKGGTAHRDFMYEQIPLLCECGRQPGRLREIGLTADRQLVIYWRCSHCRRHVYIVKDLAECWRDCATIEAGGLAAAAGPASDLERQRSRGAPHEGTA